LRKSGLFVLSSAKIRGNFTTGGIARGPEASSGMLFNKPLAHSPKFLASENCGHKTPNIQETLNKTPLKTRRE
jgi:hypothetical protein